MTRSLSFDPAHTAVLCMDYQSAIVSTYAGGQQHQLLSRAASVLRQSRQSGLPVIYIHTGFRPGLPEVSPRNLLLSAIRNSSKHQQLFQGTASAIHAGVAPEMMK